jgi:NAD(P)-dependent dehydrogenase (short-subunit alcohol dehydrogenase family)
MEPVEGKSVLITGASRGIGRATAILFAERGARVALTGRDMQALLAVEQQITNAGGQAFHLFCDVSDEWSVKRLVEDIHAEYETIDVLINNAGVGIIGPVESYPLKSWRTTISTNLTGAFLMSRQVVPIMKTQGSGRIINISSGAGRNGIANYAAYCASKFGLYGFTEALGLEVRNDGILVSTVFPGSTDTYFSGRTPEREQERESGKGRLSAYEVAEAIVGLCETNANAWTSELVIRPLRPKAQ